MDRNLLENRAVERYMQKKHNGGKSMLARCVDYVALRLILFAVAYVFYLPRFEKRTTVLLLSAITLALAMLVLHLIGEVRYQRFCIREFRSMRRQLLCDRLLLLETQLAIPLVSSLCPSGTTPVVLQRALPVDANALLSIVRTHRACGELHIFPCTAYDDSARDFAARTNGMLVLHPADELYAAAVQAGMRPEDDEVRAAIRARAVYDGKRKRHGRIRSIVEVGARKYVLIALLLMLLSFLTDYALYYRLLSSLCMTIAAFGVLRRGAARNEGGA